MSGFRFCLLIVLLQLTTAVSGLADTWSERLDSADILGKQGKYDSAIMITSDVLDQVRQEFGLSDTTVAVVLKQLGIWNARNGNLTDARQNWTEALEIYQNSQSGNNLEIAKLHSNLAAIAVKFDEFRIADSLFRLGIQEYESLSGNEDTLLAFALRAYGNCCRLQGRYGEADSVLERSYAITSRAFGPTSPQAGSVINDIGLLHMSLGNYNKADSLFREYLVIARDEYGEENSRTANAYANIGLVNRFLGNMDTAETNTREALEIRESIYGPSNAQVGNSLSELGLVRWRRGKCKEAVDAFVRAKDIIVENYGQYHSGVAFCWNGIGLAYKDQGLYVDAKEAFSRALAIQEKVFGKQHTEVAMTLNNLGLVYIDLAKYSDAELVLNEAKDIFVKTNGYNHPNVAMCLSNLGNVCRYQNRLDDAEQDYLAAIRSQGELRNDRYATYLHNLANLYWDISKRSEAESLYVEALGVWKINLGETHFRYAEGLGNLALAARERGDFDSARTLYQQAKDIYVSNFGPGHPLVALIQMDLAIIDELSGDFIKATDKLESALKIRKSILGGDHPDVAEIYGHLSRIERKGENYVRAYRYSKTAFSIMHGNFINNSRVLSESQALEFAKKTKYYAFNCMSCWLDLNDDSGDFDSSVIDVTLKVRGQASDEIFQRQQSLVNESNAQLKILADSLYELKREMAKMTFSSEINPEINYGLSYADSLRQAINANELKIAVLSDKFERDQRQTRISLKNIQSDIPDSAVLVQYVRYQYEDLSENKRIPRYLVSVIGRQGKPIVKDIGLAEPIELNIRGYRKHMLTVSDQGYPPTAVQGEEFSQLAKALYSQLINPIESNIQGSKIIMISPDGLLNLVSFASLVDSSGKYLLEKYNIHYLSDARDIIRYNSDVNDGIGLLAVGDPDFDTKSQYPEDLISKQDQNEYMEAARSRRSKCMINGELGLSRLPSTKTEVEEVATFWKGVGADSAILLLGSSASETNFRLMVTGKRYIHLATHGFYIGPDCDTRTDAGLESNKQSKWLENPLLRSGLFLAGANTRDTANIRTSTDDGILTALEVSSMALEGLRTVVLSACETGMGEVEDGEGVYGLRRAFQIAGARVVVSALWPVSDKMTELMMKHLYEAESESSSERVREMQLAQLLDMRKKGLPDHPYNWAGFIAVGDWK